MFQSSRSRLINGSPSSILNATKLFIAVALGATYLPPLSRSCITLVNSETRNVVGGGQVAP